MFKTRLASGVVLVILIGESVAIDGVGKVEYTVGCPRCFRLKTHTNFRDMIKPVEEETDEVEKPKVMCKKRK